MDSIKMKNETNPCEKEMNLSYKCLERHLGNKDKCGLEFENYKRCRSFWLKVVDERKRKGVSPLLPRNQDERDNIRLKYRNSEKPT